MDNSSYLGTIRVAVQRHLRGTPGISRVEAVRRGIADTYPETGEVMALSNIGYLVGEMDQPEDRWNGCPA
jgi:hypothetical protein